MKKDVVRQGLVIISTIFTLIMNSIANIIPLNGLKTGEISDNFKVLFVPAGYVFSIWGIIYIGLIAYTIYQTLPKQTANPILRKTGWLITLSNLANGSWIFFWHYGFYVVTLMIMSILLVVLIMVYLRLDIGRTRFNTLEKWVIAIPISIYLGWITVATMANATAVLSYLKWDGWGLSDLTWTIILLVIGVLLAGVVAFNRSDIAFLLVLVWAFTGISVRWLQLPVLNAAGFAAAGLVLLLLIYSRLRHAPART